MGSRKAILSRDCCHEQFAIARNPENSLAIIAMKIANRYGGSENTDVQYIFRGYEEGTILR